MKENVFLLLIWIHINDYIFFAFSLVLVLTDNTQDSVYPNPWKFVKNILLCVVF